MIIKYNKLPEANIVAEAYYQLKLIGINCLLEYKLDNCRFDMIILNKGEGIIIVEFKSRTLMKDFNHNTKQMQKYKKFGLPVLTCSKMEEIHTLINNIKKFF